MSSAFDIVEHICDSNHIRTYPRSTFGAQETVLRIAIKQYIPRNNPNPQPGDVTIIAAHANGFPKELYEPLWGSVMARASSQGFRIRGIWIADVAWQGASGVLNEQELGNDPSWTDHSLDLLAMVNKFRAEMPRPIIGIGHSMGGLQIAKLAHLHPRLLETIILLDPIIIPVNRNPSDLHPAAYSAVRRDRWPSREEARASFQKSPFYKTWDSRVLDLWTKHGLRDLPNVLYPAAPAQTGEVTLATSKHQEVATFLRPTPITSHATKLGPEVTHFDMAPSGIMDTNFYRSEALAAENWLPAIRASVLYVAAEKSQFNGPESRGLRMKITGTETGGSGGAKAGRVVDFCMPDAGHLVPFEKVDATADVVVNWLGAELKRWRGIEEIRDEEWKAIPDEEKARIPPKMMKAFVESLPKRKPAPKL